MYKKMSQEPVSHSIKCIFVHSAVCVDFLNRLYGSLTSAHRELTPSLVEEELIQACAVAQGKEARLVRTHTQARKHNLIFALLWRNSVSVHLSGM